MKIVRLIILISISLLSVAACQKKSEFKNSAPKKDVTESKPIEKSNYLLRDSIELDMGPMLYTGAFLYKDSGLLDTIETDFGIKWIGTDSIVYQKILIQPETLWNSKLDTIQEIITGGGLGPLVLYDGENRIILNRKLPFYSNFSAPNVLNGELLYWGIDADSNWNCRILAMRYRIKEKEMDSVYLFNTIMGTDNSSYFQPPSYSDGYFIFMDEAGHPIKLTMDFATISK